MSTSGADPGDLEDAELIARSVTRPDWFSAIFDRHAAHIHRYLVRRVGPTAAEDALGEVFLVAFRKREGYDTERRDARPWLYGIATNLVAQRRREEVKELKLREALGPPAHEEGHAERVAEQVTAASMGKLLDSALAGLSDGDRDALTLFAGENLSYGEVASALGIPLGTVRSRLNRARRQVRETLGHPEITTSKEIATHG
ncbi:RNA polymerase sigma factor [Amycolatopsis regifaucium]|uniref:RNA polymerase subunit sigma-70 n=1 Tax=Amycolatopsis regifaucium TaxID=546365 RepID=A0A154MWN5_9PSEU|nr:RNA polymerase sigma factor [Amycolatopsis regifaucium]KZB88685.1 RNA polymerase subunit sigma-70 [Amycolatopsis regifaucium]OKA07144.1 RNA polymerase subunit sigma-70 [Amycolatopsis regifaucium]SFI56742.1 RNA polymerase sigma-70 factor, ECF subfamily [Amycolatopsis regifaucium]